MDKLWINNECLNKDIEEYTVSDDFILDRALLKYDCIGSKAHAQMLEFHNVITESEMNLITSELDNIVNLSDKGIFIVQKSDEDCHSAIEKHLIKKLGDTGKKIHTFRSRNDQVLTALRLYIKDNFNILSEKITNFILEIDQLLKKYGEIAIPGYTHTRKAMPSTVKMWANSFKDSMADNLKLLNCIYDILDQSPLGTGAGYGFPLEINRELTSQNLGFKKVQDNPIYTQNSRHKFEGMVLNCLSQVMLDLNRLSSDLIFFSDNELGFFLLPDAFCTGSSIMPHKKNPDVLEILRGNYHKIYGFEQTVRQICVNLISGYHRDMQLTKRFLMEGFQLTLKSMDIITLLFKNLSVSKKNAENCMTKELFLTENTFKLTEKGIPFRDAYHIIKEGL